MGKRKQAESRPVVVNSSSTSPPQYVQLDLNSLYKAQNIYLHDFVGLVFSSALGNVLTEWTRGVKRELHLISMKSLLPDQVSIFIRCSDTYRFTP